MPRAGRGCRADAERSASRGGRARGRHRCRGRGRAPRRRSAGRRRRHRRTRPRRAAARRSGCRRRRSARSFRAAGRSGISLNASTSFDGGVARPVVAPSASGRIVSGRASSASAGVIIGCGGAGKGATCDSGEHRRQAQCGQQAKAEPPVAAADAGPEIGRQIEVADAVDQGGEGEPRRRRGQGCAAAG